MLDVQIENKEKYCSNCKDIKSISNFSKNKNMKDGLQVWCKKCSGTKTKEYKVKTKENYFRYLLKSAKTRAKKDNKEFNLDLEWIILNCPSNCPVYDTPLIFDSDNDYEKPSIDKLNPNLGYTKENCRIISWKANYKKNNLTLDDLEKLVQYLKNNQADNQ